MKKISTLFITIIFLLTTNLVVSAQPTDAVNINPMYSYILIDAKSGQVLLENKADDKLRPASTTKIMTAIVAIENGKLDKVMNVSKEAVNDIGVGGMNIGIQEGESNLTLENLLNVMLIKSANETANIISENVFPTKQEFIDKMNAKAKALGATNTYYVNPCGKDDTKTDQEQLTTARDLSTIARYGMTIPEFRQIVSKEYYKDLPATNRHKTWPPLRTTNQLLWNNPKYTYNINGTDHTYTVEGIKTGFTSGAGHNLVTAAFNEDGMELIAVVMHVSGSTNKIFEYTKNLYKYGFEHYDNKK